MIKNTHIFLIILSIFSCNKFFAQTNSDVKSIKVKKESYFVKAAFDETEYKVIAFDKYGNPHEDAIKSFTIFYKEKNNIYENAMVGNTFSNQVIKFFTKKKKLATKICITKIMAENSEGHLEPIPDLCDIVIFPDCKNKKK